jgi:hypothetical protein
MIRADVMTALPFGLFLLMSSNHRMLQPLGSKSDAPRPDYNLSLLPDAPVSLTHYLRIVRAIMLKGAEFSICTMTGWRCSG